MRNDRPKERKIHIALPEEVHQRLRVSCAVEGVSMQQFVERLLTESVKEVRVPVVNRERQT